MSTNSLTNNGKGTPNIGLKSNNSSSSYSSLVLKKKRETICPENIFKVVSMSISEGNNSNPVLDKYLT